MVNGYTLLWKIQNINHCTWMKKTVIESPEFVADALEGTRWGLLLYPVEFSDENNIGLFLYRKYGGGPTIIQVKYHLALLDKDGSVLIEKRAMKNDFSRGNSWGFSQFESREKVSVSERTVFCPEDTLTVQCTVWNGQETPVETKLVSARTVFTDNRKSFLWKIDKFSAIETDQKKKFKDSSLDFDIVLKKKEDNGNELLVNINSVNENINYFALKTSVVDSEGQKECWKTHENLTNDLKKGEFSTLIFFKQLMENKSKYLPDDVLSLDFESITWVRTDSYEYIGPAISPESKLEIFETKDDNNFAKKESPISSTLANALKSMYSDAIFCDTEFRTSTQTFSAHKCVLSARSPVFKKMFSNDMKEKNSGHVDITDFDDDTIHRMLLYLYTDNLEDMQFEGALKLYTIADKYEIMLLRSSCSSFLRENLCPTNACDVLDLADLHQDEDLKTFVLDYILAQGKGFFRSQKWKDFMSARMDLAQYVMYKIICQE